MKTASIPLGEFEQRIANIRQAMAARGVDAFFVYGDEYRKENLRYVSNYWPIFERGGMLLGREGTPVVLCAPRASRSRREMSVWPDVRLLPDFLCVTVPDEIDYPLATYTSFRAAAELREKAAGKLGVAGLKDMPAVLLKSIEAAFLRDRRLRGRAV